MTDRKAPYRFAPIAETWLPSPIYDQKGPDGNPLTGPDHSRPMGEAICGHMQVKFRNETPILVGGAENGEQFIWKNDFAIPGSSLRGVIRSTMEIAARGRLTFVDDFVGYSRDLKADRWREECGPWPQGSARGGGFLVGGANGDGAPKYGIVKAQIQTIAIMHILSLIRQFGGHEISKSVWRDASMADRLKYLQEAGLDGFQPLSRFQNTTDTRRTMLVISGPTVLSDTELSRVEDVVRKANRVNILKGDLTVNRWLEAQYPERKEILDAIKNDGQFISDNDERTALHIDKAAEHLFILPEEPIAEALDTKTVDQFLKSLHRRSNASVESDSSDERAFVYDEQIDGRNIAPFTADRHNKEAHEDRLNTAIDHQVDNLGRFGLPIFLKPGRGGRQQDILSLTALIRMPFQRTLYDAARKTQNPGSNQLDLVQALFGWAAEDDEFDKDNPQKTNLRSRVKFGMATGPEADPKLMESKGNVAMPQPHPSFWPFYLTKADGNGKSPFDYDNPASRLAGRKRYPVADQRPFITDVEGNANDLTFVKAGQTFCADIYVHNITKVELGALIWCLTLGDLSANSGRYHALGRAKGYGYGRLQVSVTPKHLKEAVSGEVPDLEAAVEAFKFWMKEKTEQDFDTLPEIRSLISMATPVTNPNGMAMLMWPGTSLGQVIDSERILKAYVGVKSEAQKKGQDAPMGLPLP